MEQDSGTRAAPTESERRFVVLPMTSPGTDCLNDTLCSRPACVCGCCVVRPLLHIFRGSTQKPSPNPGYTFLCRRKSWAKMIGNGDACSWLYCIALFYGCCLADVLPYAHRYSQWVFDESQACSRNNELCVSAASEYHRVQKKNSRVVGHLIHHSVAR